MLRVLILAEGQTEERFIKDVLTPHLATFDVYVRASVVRTKEPPAGSPFKGGLLSYGKVEKDIYRLLDDTDAIVTTMIDLYGLPKDFPGLGGALNRLSAQKKVHFVQDAFAQNINHVRFRPFVALHEFEALVLASSQSLGDHFNNQDLTVWCQKTIDDAGGPELVNDDPTTAPSKRLIAKIAGYGKVLNGPAIVAKEGLSAVRSRCPHFNSWIVWLESLAPKTVI
jgi:Domain of unknown function (DUF4276)